MSDKSASTTLSETRRRDKKTSSLDSLAQDMSNSAADGKQWNQNRAYFLRTGWWQFLANIARRSS